MAEKPKQRATLSLDADLVAEVDQLARAQGESRSSMVEQLLRDALERQDTFARMMESDAFRHAFMELFTRPDVLRTMMGTDRDKPRQKLLRFLEDVEEAADRRFSDDDDVEKGSGE